MSSVGMASPAKAWLLENGPAALDDLLRTIVCSPASAVVLADAEGHSLAVSGGVSKLLGLPPERLIGRRLVEFSEPEAQAEAARLWKRIAQQDEERGTLLLRGAKPVDLEAKVEVLPVRHLVTLREQGAEESATTQDFAVCLLNEVGVVVAWYAGATRLYGYGHDQVMGRSFAALQEESEEGASEGLEREFQLAQGKGHSCTECWQRRQDGSRFWANVITTALRDKAGVLQGFARVTRDFSERHERDEKLRRQRARVRPVPAFPTIAGTISGDVGNSPELNDALLEMLGYTREDVALGHMVWAELTPNDYLLLDEVAHEEGIRFGACTPYEKELQCKDGTRIPVLVTTAVINLAPFRWITMVQDLRERNRFESVEVVASEATGDFGEIVGGSPALRRVEQQIEVVAPTDATVLILGETGTGKELVARAIHRMSPRRNLPFVTLNCAAIPTGLLESELFGYERGAFTGALTQKIGRFEMAHRGTLFLDEVGDIPIDLQPKLLRALQEKSFERLGGIRTIPIDVRLVAATNRNLTEMMVEKQFRSDLYYRLKVFPITTPPLRERPEDIPVLARHFTRKYAEKMGRTIDKIPSETMRALQAWQWPGNVRELENFIERAVILSVGPNLRAPISEIREASPQTEGTSSLEQVERDHILRILRETNGVITTAATRLGLHRTTLNAMMRKLGISRKDL